MITHEIAEKKTGAEECDEKKAREKKTFPRSSIDYVGIFFFLCYIILLQSFRCTIYPIVAKQTVQK